MRIQVLHKILLVIAGISIIGCSDEATCIPENSDLLRIAFVDGTGDASEITFVEVAVNGSNEYFPVLKDTTVTNLSIPLDPKDSLIILSFVRSTATNQLAISYKALPLLVDPKCGFEALFKLNKIEQSSFGKVEIVNSTLNKDITTNVKITL